MTDNYAALREAAEKAQKLWAIASRTDSYVDLAKSSEARAW